MFSTLLDLLTAKGPAVNLRKKKKKSHIYLELSAKIASIRTEKLMYFRPSFRSECYFTAKDMAVSSLCTCMHVRGNSGMFGTDSY